jgi:hypothetical protein
MTTFRKNIFSALQMVAVCIPEMLITTYMMLPAFLQLFIPDTAIALCWNKAGTQSTRSPQRNFKNNWMNSTEKNRFPLHSSSKHAVTYTCSPSTRLRRQLNVWNKDLTDTTRRYWMPCLTVKVVTFQTPVTAAVSLAGRFEQGRASTQRRATSGYRPALPSGGPELRLHH